MRDLDDDDDGPSLSRLPIRPWPAVPASLSLDFAASPWAPASRISEPLGSEQPAVGGAAPLFQVSGMLDLTVPFMALAGFSAEPGSLSRLGPISAPEARNLAVLAALDPAVRWRIILTNASGQAIGVAHLPRARTRARAGADVSIAGAEAGAGVGGAGTRQASAPARAGLVGRITITIPESILDPASPGQLDNVPASAGPAGNLAAVLDAALGAAAVAAAKAARSQEADANSGGCAHDLAAAGYRPPPGLREYITARDLTCRFLTCRQPAWRGDLDHTIPWDKGGRTCTCNLGGLCRFHHRLKQHLGWTLTQIAPGIFTWTTPTGRRYTTAPDVHS